MLTDSLNRLTDPERARASWALRPDVAAMSSACAAQKFWIWPLRLLEARKDYKIACKISAYV